MRFSSTLTDPTFFQQQQEIVWINRVNTNDTYFCWLRFFNVLTILVNIIFDCYSNVYKTVFIDIKAKFVLSTSDMAIEEILFFSEEKMHQEL